MRTLVDLLSDDRGYVRIFAEAEGYGYELSTYQPLPMCGYDSAVAASEAAHLQLQAAGRVKTVRRRRRF